MKITILGIGYVGISNAILLAKKNKVVAYDILKEKIEDLNNGVFPDEEKIDYYYNLHKQNLEFSSDIEYSLKDTDYVIISTPTNYSELKDSFDVSSIIDSLNSIKKYAPSSQVIIKSTIPIGFVNSLKEDYKDLNVVFVPEFLRESKAIIDSFYPSRIIIGTLEENGKDIFKLFSECIEKEKVEVLYTDTKEAETIKLFANTYLAMRVAFFNELDSFALYNNLDSSQIIKGVSLDDRIGNYYNNPSFGYGGYCFPKDSKQLKSAFKNVPNSLVKAVVSSNDIRKEFLAKTIIDKDIKTLGIYRLVMKSNSDNFRSSAVMDIIDMLKEELNIIIYEPLVKDDTYMGLKVYKEFEKFEKASDLIIANRIEHKLKDVENKVFTRDIFNRD